MFQKMIEQLQRLTEDQRIIIEEYSEEKRIVAYRTIYDSDIFTCNIHGETVDEMTDSFFYAVNRHLDIVMDILKDGE